VSLLVERAPCMDIQTWSNAAVLHPPPQVPNSSPVKKNRMWVAIFLITALVATQVRSATARRGQGAFRLAPRMENSDLPRGIPSLPRADSAHDLVTREHAREPRHARRWPAAGSFPVPAFSHWLLTTRHGNTRPA
jgi:hypothetical protein